MELLDPRFAVAIRGNKKEGEAAVTAPPISPLNAPGTLPNLF